jgi:hypothetical protein
MTLMIRQRDMMITIKEANKINTISTTNIRTKIKIRKNNIKIINYAETA